MPKFKAIKTSKIQSALQDFPKEFMNQLRIILPFVQRYGFLQETLSCGKSSKYAQNQKVSGSRFEQLIPHTSQTILRSSNTNFGVKVTKAFLSAEDLL